MTPPLPAMTGLESTPTWPMLIVTVSPGASVKPISGTMPVPVEMITPSGKSCPANRQSARSCSGRLIWLVLARPDHATVPFLVISMLISRSPALTSQAGRMPGASAHDPA